MESRLSIGVNRFLHMAFVLLGVYYLGFTGDTSAALCNFGISLAFDPFNADQPFAERHWWQKAWLLMLVAATLGGLMVTLIR